MKLYAGERFGDYVEKIQNSIITEIKSQTDNYLLNVNVDDYTEHLIQRFEINVPELHFDQVFADTVEKEIPGSRFPRFEFNITDPYKTHRKQIIIYHIPYDGDINILQLRPNPMSLISTDISVDSRQKWILIEIINFYNDPNRINGEYTREIGDITSNYHGLRSNCSTFNAGLSYFIKSSIESRRQEILNKNQLLHSLGVPIRQKEGVAKTFSVPSPKLKEKIVVKPTVIEKGFAPEPALDISNYHKILKLINDIGKNLERMPSTYAGKGEEDIRDHILLVVDPNFEYGSAGGETFNKTGKTDISLRHDSSVVFVAECKYWRGEKTFFKTIDQLLGYLTWRDSKVAVVNFVQNTDFTDVLEKTKASIQNHPNFLKETSPSDQTWFNYKFHLNGDRNREIDLAVISFHLPK